MKRYEIFHDKTYARREIFTIGKRRLSEIRLSSDTLCSGTIAILPRVYSGGYEIRPLVHTRFSSQTRTQILLRAMNCALQLFYVTARNIRCPINNPKRYVIGFVETEAGTKWLEPYSKSHSTGAHLCSLKLLMASMLVLRVFLATALTTYPLNIHY